MSDLTQAEGFRLLMRARWGRFPASHLPAIAKLWHLRPEQIPWLSAAPLRVAQHLNLEVELLNDFSARITFLDGTTVRVSVVGQQFLD